MQPLPTREDKCSMYEELGESFRFIGYAMYYLQSNKIKLHTKEQEISSPALVEVPIAF